jgi:hypothetical protein
MQSLTRRKKLRKLYRQAAGYVDRIRARHVPLRAPRACSPGTMLGLPRRRVGPAIGMPRCCHVAPLAAGHGHYYADHLPDAFATDGRLRQWAVAAVALHRRFARLAATAPPSTLQKTLGKAQKESTLASPSGGEDSAASMMKPGLPWSAAPFNRVNDLVRRFDLLR